MLTKRRWIPFFAVLIAASPLLPQPAGAAAIVPNGSWTVYHRDDGHTGNDPTLPKLSTATQGWISPILDEQIYASPLVQGGLVYAATLNNTVYALNQSDGTVVWSKNLGAPMTSGWTCGNVSPQGILGTPVIDVPGNRIYVTTLTSDGIYRVVGLDLSTGTPTLTTQLNLGSSFDWRIEQQRGALAVRNGYVYVPFGGRWGDCGTYHGFVVAVPTNGPANPPPYQTPGNGSGIWSTGGVVIDDTTGNVFVTTGNGTGTGCSSANQNDAVVKLSPTLALQDWFMPQDWQANWCQNDEDLGSAGPLLISPNLLFQSGKWGGGFLLNPNNLGGVDGQLFPTPKPVAYLQAETCFGNHHDATFGSFAYAAPFVYVECEGHGLVALNVNAANPSFTECASSCGAPSWSAGGSATFGPPIVAAGAVWVADNSGLFAYDAISGTEIYHSASFGINRFVTPAEAGGHVFVPSQTVVRSFDMVFEPGQSLGGILTAGSGASSWDSTRNDVFAPGGSDNALYHSWSTGSGFTGWESLGGGLQDSPGAVSWGSGRIDVFLDGRDNQLWHRYWGGAGWSGWEPLGGILSAGPGVAAWSPNRLDIFARGADNQLWHRYWSGTGWGSWEPLGGGLNSGPGVAAWSSNRLDIFIQGTDDQLWQKSWTGNGWSSWRPLGGIITAAPAVASCAPGMLDVFARGSDDALWRKSFNGSWGNWTLIGGRWTSGIAAVCRPGTASIDVFARGTDKAIWHLSQ